MQRRQDIGSSYPSVVHGVWNRSLVLIKGLISLRFLKFCIVGLSGVFVNMGLLYALTEFLGLFYMLSSFIAIECSFISNFLLNDLWTWRGVGASRHIERLKRLGKFHVVYGIGLAINIGLLYIITEYLGVYYIVSNLVAIAVATLWNFWWSAKWTWGSF